MTEPAMGEVSIYVTDSKSGEHWQTVKGVKVSKNFAVTEPTARDGIFTTYKLTHCPSGYGMANIGSITTGRKWARRLEKLGDWGAIRQPSDVTPELAKAAYAVMS